MSVSVTMASGLDRLEKLFNSARRKNKAAQEKKAAQKKQESVFPSPSFLRPTSIQMMPRDARGQNLGAVPEDRGRSHSLPEPNPNDEWPSSTLLSSDHEPYEQAKDEPLRDFLSSGPKSNDDHDDDVSIAPRLSEFKFPEDALFRHDEIMRISGEASPQTESSGSTLSKMTTKGGQSPREKRSLDHPPTHISSQLNTPGPKMGATLQVGKSGKAEPQMLLPSPIITRTGTVTQKRPTSTGSEATLTSPTSPTSPPKQAFESKFSLFPKTRPRAPFPVPNLDSPPASDNEEDNAASQAKRPVSTSSLPTPDRSTTSSLESPSRFQMLGDEEERQYKRNTWETWGRRSADPAPGTNAQESNARENDEDIPSELLRQPASVATLSVIIGRAAARESIIQAPTIEDFYGLSDDAVAEPLSAPPALNPGSVSEPSPPPPPKDTAPSRPTTSREPSDKDDTPLPHITSHPTGDTTPPCTPKDAQFLTVDCAPHDVVGAQGAIWCARIAEKYHLDMVYVVSLWPEAAGAQGDPSSRRPLAGSPVKSVPGAALRNCAVTLHPKSATTGRLLAGYGLGEVVSPFRIAHEPHLGLLRSTGWAEYHTRPASAEDLSHGWAHAFYSDRVAADGGDDAEPGRPATPPDGPNRGIVFGAYVKRANRARVTGRKGPEKQAHLDRMLADVRTLVDALIDWT